MPDQLSLRQLAKKWRNEAHLDRSWGLQSAADELGHWLDEAEARLDAGSGNAAYWINRLHELFGAREEPCQPKS